MANTIKTLGSQAYADKSGLLDIAFATKADVAEQAAATFRATKLGVNKGNVKLDLYNAAGTLVNSIKNEFTADLSVELTATDGASGNASSTATATKWNVNTTDFGPGSKIVMTISGKTGQESFGVDGSCSGNMSGSGHAEITLPFYVEFTETPGSDG